MSRFILISPSADYERKVRASIAPLRGSLQFYQAAYLPERLTTSFGSRPENPRRS